MKDQFDVAQRAISHLANIALRLGRERLCWNPDTERVRDNDKANAMLTPESRKAWAIWCADFPGRYQRETSP